MKSQTIARILIFVGLLVVANAIKPLTTKNIANHLLTSVRPWAAILPESSRSGMEVVHHLAMSVGRSLIDNDGSESFWTIPVKAADKVTLAQAVVQQRVKLEENGLDRVQAAKPLQIRRRDYEPAATWETALEEEPIGEVAETEVAADVQTGFGPSAATTAAEPIYLASAAPRPEEQTRKLILMRLIKPAMIEELNQTLLTVVPQLKESACQNQEIERQLMTIIELARRKQNEKAREAILQCELEEKHLENNEMEKEGATPNREGMEERTVEMPIVPAFPLRPPDCLIPPQK